ncbi:cytosine deaminase-like metal-dependent hydrolase [Chthonomonas calidirosea]|uniref:Cytosine deaminase and related metal-dependent hydrolases n=1 Tax=Chthonomonas calidirosea (strain DSM 23976 / ICMP 18418 / T49) TaxID=1303518 RepID=S0EUM2_CHTCT|nr:amidohydrolase family protein [Chthonomonas calidirosea]CCW35052.1 Cytosine deaminase and related metal-dependent hydrolases [Chthonomonas calidirosea T49]CEK20933.1 cytosine deaminase-like metal-dependent hydrolase [Chthonomonas calidirosea]
MSDRFVLRANWVVPVTKPPIAQGEVVVEEGRIAEVRPARGVLDARTGRDFGEAVILPGFVNAHTHLDYTLFRGLVEDREFFAWIRELVKRSRLLSKEDWRVSAMLGAAEAVASGITTIGDCTPTGASLEAAKMFGLGGVIYQEVFGIGEDQTVEEILRELAQKVVTLKEASNDSRLTIGISPHAPYTVRPALFQALARWAHRQQVPICIHAAESREELELLLEGRGIIAQSFEERRISWRVPHQSVVAYLDALGIVGPQTLLVHGVNVSVKDCVLAQQRGAAWVHCPKSNAKLGNGIAPLALLSTYHGAESRVGLGTDSVVSNNTLDMIEEMRFAVLLQRAARRQVDALTAEQAVKLATLGGANALGLKDVGVLEIGKRADLCVVRLDRLHTTPYYDPYSALVYTARASDVVLAMIDGRVRYDATLHAKMKYRFPENDLVPLFESLSHITARLQASLEIHR